jgi:hypothetical protein
MGGTGRDAEGDVDLILLSSIGPGECGSTHVEGFTAPIGSDRCVTFFMP